jgi:membrane protein implicated in regulation of membrane protease activity
MHDVREIDEIKGGFGVVTEAIEAPSLSGKVEFHGTSWNAVAEAPIAKGTRVEILRRDNLTLHVKE